MLEKEGVFMNKLKKALIALSVVAAGALIGYGIYNESQKNVNLNFTQTEFEYGCADVDFNLYLNLGEDDKEIRIVATEFDEKKVGKQEVTFEIYRPNLRCYDKTYTFEVKDTQLPEIVLNKESVVVEFGGKYEAKDNIKSVTDPVDGDLEYTIEGEVDTKKVGTYTQKIITKDLNNNETNKEFNVEVKDTKKPEIVFKNSSITLTVGSNKYDPKTNIKSVTDPVDGKLEYKVEGKVDTKKVGTYTIKVSAKDSNENETKKEFKVYVKNKQVVSSSGGSSNSGSSNSGSSGATVNTSNYPLTYQDGSAKITIYKEWYQNAWVYAAHLQFTNYSRFGTAVANGRYGGGTETTYHAANRLGAIFAVNGDYSSPNLNYPVARSGKVWNNKNCWVPAVYSRGNGKLMSAWETGGTPGIAGQDLATLVSQGKVSDTFSFGPPILSGGSITVGSDSSRAQRTFIGTNGNPGDIWVVVSEGRYTDGKSAGLTYRQCAQFLKNKGCSFGVPLDGGGSSTMIFKGKILTATSQRAVVDFVYFK